MADRPTYVSLFAGAAAAPVRAGGARVMTRLTDAQRDLAAAWVPLAGAIAARYARRLPRGRYDELRSAALFGLVDAAARFAPGRGVKFKTYAARRILGAMLDFARGELPAGFRRAGAGPKAVSLSAALATSELRAGGVEATGGGIDPCDGGVLGDALADPGRLPVGWELEAADAVDHLSRACGNRRAAEAVRRLYLDAGATMRAVGAAMGCRKSQASRLVRQAFEAIRQRGTA